MSRQLEEITASLLDVYAKRLDSQQRAEMLEALDVLARDAKYNVFKNTFPEDGKYSIHAYPKHKEFFDASATYTESAFIAGNRCITPWTFVSTPIGEKPAHEVFASEGADVLSWDGAREDTHQVSGGFLKCIEPAYRLVMEDGAFFDCTREHRVLAESGWMSLAQLMSQSSGLRYWQTPEDYQANCVEDGYLCDQSLPSAGGTAPASLPKGVYARKQLLSFSRKDAEGRISQCNHAYRSGDLLSTPDDPNRLSALYGQFQGAYVPQSVLPLKENSLSQELFGLESSQKQALSQVLVSQKDRLSLCAELREFLDTSNNSQLLSRLIAYDWQSPNASSLVHSTQELLRDDHYIATFFPFEHPPLIGGKRIVAVVPLGYQPIVDATVSEVKNYKAGGVFHHNTGKSVAGAYLTVCHATGIYPDWWKGKRYHKPIMIWVGGDTSVTCRDIIQFKLLGDIGDHGSGMIPKDLIVDTKTRRNVPDAVETIRIRHISGGISTIVIKTYEQGRIAWQGSEVDFIWIDEECPQDVYGEALIRLMTTKGSIILTFTPLNGLTPLVLTFIDGDQHTDAEFPKFVANCTWSDVPHLDAEDIAKMLAATPPNLRDARSKGIPTVGDGAIYPLPLDHITVDDFKIPKWWPKAYGMDVGWNCTAAAFGAWDRENDVIYIYSEHKQGQADVSVHSSAIRSRGKWMRGAIDPASRASSQIDGQKLFLLYSKSVDQGGGGLNLTLAANAVEAGIFTVWDRLQSGRLKYFKSCTQLQREHGLYHRKDGKVVKTNDHLEDTVRYLCMADANIWKYPESEVGGHRSKVIDISQHFAGAI